MMGGDPTEAAPLAAAAPGAPAGEQLAAVHPATTSGALVRGGLWYLGGQAVTLVAALVATPFVIRLLGTEGYGVLALIHLLMACLVFTDVGMGLASTKLGAEAHARGDDEGELAAIWTGLVLGSSVAVLAAALLVIGARPLLDRGLHLPAHLLEEATWALRFAALGLVGRAATGVLNTPQLARMRMRLHSAVTTGGALAQIVLIPPVLWLGGGLAGAGAVIGGAALATALAQALVARSLLPRLARPRFDRGLFRRMAKVGGALVVTSLAGLALVNGEKVLLTRLVSVEALAYYTVAFTLANLLSVPAASLYQAMLPAFAGHHARGQGETLARLHGELLRGSLLLLPPAALVLCLAAEPFFTHWAGPEFGTASTPLFLLLTIGLVANVTAYVPGCLLLAVDRAGFVARFHLVEVVPYLLLALAMILAWGSAGAAGASSLRLAVALPVLLLAARRSLGPSVATLPRIVGPGYVAALAALVVPPLVGWLLARSWSGALLPGVAGIALYGGIVFAFVCREPERAWLRHRLRRLRPA